MKNANPEAWEYDLTLSYPSNEIFQNMSYFLLAIF